MSHIVAISPPSMGALSVDTFAFEFDRAKGQQDWRNLLMIIINCDESIIPQAVDVAEKLRRWLIEDMGTINAVDIGVSNGGGGGWFLTGIFGGEDRQ